MEIINLTPHNVNIRSKEGREVAFPPSDKVMRVNYIFEEYGVLDVLGDKKITVERKRYTAINDEDIEIKPYKIYIVSHEVLRAMKDLNYPLLHQFVAPNTNKANRSTEGTIIDVDGFITL